jgi:hypothetical protein
VVNTYVWLLSALALVGSLIGAHEIGHYRGVKAGVLKTALAAKAAAEQTLIDYKNNQAETLQLAKKGRVDDAKIKMDVNSRVADREHRLRNLTAQKPERPVERTACAGSDSERDAIANQANTGRTSVDAQLAAYARAVARLEAHGEQCAARAERANQTLRDEEAVRSGNN